MGFRPYFTHFDPAKVIIPNMKMAMATKKSGRILKTYTRHDHSDDNSTGYMMTGSGIPGSLRMVKGDQ